MAEFMHPDLQLRLAKIRCQELINQAAEERLARSITNLGQQDRKIWQKVKIDQIRVTNCRRKETIDSKYREPEKCGRKLAWQVARVYHRLEEMGLPSELAAIKAWFECKEVKSVRR